MPTHPLDEFDDPLYDPDDDHDDYYDPPDFLHLFDDFPEED